MSGHPTNKSTISNIYGSVNHRKHFVDHKTGVHTQNIENHWKNLKSKRPNIMKGEEGSSEWLVTYTWMKNHKDNFWEYFIQVWKNHFHYE